MLLSFQVSRKAFVYTNCRRPHGFTAGIASEKLGWTAYRIWTLLPVYPVLPDTVLADVSPRTVR